MQSAGVGKQERLDRLGGTRPLFIYLGQTRLWWSQLDKLHLPFVTVAEQVVGSGLGSLRRVGDSFLRRKEEKTQKTVVVWVLGFVSNGCHGGKGGWLVGARGGISEALRRVKVELRESDVPIEG